MPFSVKANGMSTSHNTNEISVLHSHDLSDARLDEHIGSVGKYDSFRT